MAGHMLASLMPVFYQTIDFQPSKSLLITISCSHIISFILETRRITADFRRLFPNSMREAAILRCSYNIEHAAADGHARLVISATPDTCLPPAQLHYDDATPLWLWYSRLCRMPAVYHLRASAAFSASRPTISILSICCYRPDLISERARFKRPRSSPVPRRLYASRQAGKAVNAKH